MCLKIQECRSCFGRPARGGVGDRGVGVGVADNAGEAEASKGTGVAFWASGVGAEVADERAAR